MLAWIPQGPAQILLNNYTPWYKEKGSHQTKVKQPVKIETTLKPNSLIQNEPIKW